MNDYLKEAQERAIVVEGWGEERTKPVLASREDELARVRARDQLVVYYAWAIPNDASIKKLVELSPIVEVAAGGGYWASLVIDAGGAIKPFDIDPRRENEWAKQQWTAVEQGNEYVAAAYPERTLLMVWPPSEDLTAEWALEQHRNAGGERIAYVGEWEGGSNATPGFFAMLERDYECVAEVDIPRYEGCTDGMSVWERS